MLTFSSCLRHAFFEGAGYGDLERISEEDQKRWVKYDPSELAPFKRMQAAIDAHDELLAGLRAIIDRADNGELGTSKVQDMRRIAAALLAKHGGAA
ncbi:hypothetical protein [Rhizobium sp. S9]|uniref:hypothetical protein n=1 Tax=Rhizobium sp. S9 TaxID=2035454 RepID=UPI001141BE02|nr:hypothetical protein [Rhizobium sp. S9]